MRQPLFAFLTAFFIGDETLCIDRAVKMAPSDWVKIPVLASLAVIVVLVGGSIVASLVSTARAKA